MRPSVSDGLFIYVLITFGYNQLLPVMNVKQIAVTTLFSIAAVCAQAQNTTFPETSTAQNEWVDSVFRKLNKRQKIAQLFFVRAHTNLGKAYEDSVGRIIKKEKLGGVVFFQGGPGRQAALTNVYQSLSKVPLLIASDGEWGLGMRLDSAVSYPYQMALGAVQNKDLIYRMGQEVAKDFKRIGMHMNLGPVVDINNNPKNPVINYRSFGENKYNVAVKAAAYMLGMQNGGLLTSLKHFPGHGDTDVDSHYDLPRLTFTRERLDSLEMYPFRELIRQGATGVMSAHMNIPSLDGEPNVASSLSRPIVTDILKKELGFKGLVITDGMGMGGVVKNFPNGEADVRAVIAGNDIVELSLNSERAINLVRKAIRQDRVSMGQIDSSVKKILAAKYWVGLNRKDTVDEHNVLAGVTRPESLVLQQQLADAAVTLLRGKENIRQLTAEKRTAIISIGTLAVTAFQRNLGAHYKRSVFYTLDRNANANQIAKVLAGLSSFDQVIVSIHDTRIRPGNGILLSDDLKMFIKDMAKKQTLFALFANPYNLAALSGLESSNGLLVAYQKDDFMQHAAASVFKNQLVPTGKLPITVSPFFKYGDGE